MKAIGRVPRRGAGSNERENASTLQGSRFAYQDIVELRNDVLSLIGPLMRLEKGHEPADLVERQRHHQPLPPTTCSTLCPADFSRCLAAPSLSHPPVDERERFRGHTLLSTTQYVTLSLSLEPKGKVGDHCSTACTHVKACSWRFISARFTREAGSRILGRGPRSRPCSGVEWIAGMGGGAAGRGRSLWRRARFFTRSAAPLAGLYLSHHVPACRGRSSLPAPVAAGSRRRRLCPGSASTCKLWAGIL